VARKGVKDLFFGSVARKGVTGAFFVSVAKKEFSGFCELAERLARCLKAYRRRRANHEGSISC
jgi:hypothetical protein